MFKIYLVEEDAEIRAHNRRLSKLALAQREMADLNRPTVAVDEASGQIVAVSLDLAPTLVGRDLEYLHQLLLDGSGWRQPRPESAQGAGPGPTPPTSHESGEIPYVRKQRNEGLAQWASFLGGLMLLFGAIGATIALATIEEPDRAMKSGVIVISAVLGSGIGTLLLIGAALLRQPRS